MHCKICFSFLFLNVLLEHQFIACAVACFGNKPFKSCSTKTTRDKNICNLFISLIWCAVMWMATMSEIIRPKGGMSAKRKVASVPIYQVTVTSLLNT